MQTKKVSRGRFIGAVGLIVGTTIGVGMLGQPVACSLTGFFPTALLFIGIWLWLFISARFFLEVNIHLKGEPNFISMVARTLGPVGKGITWVIYLFLLYALLSAYISGGSILLASFIKQIFNFDIPSKIEPFLLPGLLGGFLYLGTRGIDLINRVLMVGLIISLSLLFSFLPGHFEHANLSSVHWNKILLPVSIITTSFGYHIVIPSLSTYLNHDRKSLKKALLIGSLIPLVVYLCWQVLIMAAIDQVTLQTAFEQGIPVTELLFKSTGSNALHGIGSAFAFFAIATSFLGVAMSLSDFLKDGLKLKRNVGGELLAVFFAFLPPFFFVFFYSEGFYLALKYAGTLVALLLGAIPALMILKWKELKPWKGYHRSTAWTIFIISLFLAAIDLWQA